MRIAGIVSIVQSVVVVSALVTPRVAEAQCMAPGAALFPLTDRVPPLPTLYRYEVAWAAAAPIRVEGPGGPVPFTARDVSTSKDLRVTAIAVDARAGSFTVHGGGYGAPRTFTVDAGVRFEERIPRWTDADIAWVDEAWTCSHTRGLVIKLRAPGAVAFRASWPDGHRELVPPHDSEFMISAMGGKLDPADARVFLGHPNCVTDLIDPAYIGRRDVGLVAIYPDGSEGVVGEPSAIGCGFREADGRNIVGFEPTYGPAAPPAPAARPTPMTWAIAAAALLGALTTVLLVLLVRRRTAAVP